MDVNHSFGPRIRGPRKLYLDGDKSCKSFDIIYENVHLYSSSCLFFALGGLHCVLGDPVKNKSEIVRTLSNITFLLMINRMKVCQSRAFNAYYIHDCHACKVLSWRLKTL